jgi:Ala-tRNA(Pro) deacylase
MISENKKAVYDKLDSMGITYEACEHEAVFTIEDVDKAGAFDKGMGCKNLFLRDGGGKRHFLLVAEEHTEVDLKDVRAQLGCSRLSFGSEERLWNCLKLTPGSVSPFGVINDTECKVEVVFDKQLVGQKLLGFHPNDNTATVWISFDDVKRVVEDNGNDVYYVELVK